MLPLSFSEYFCFKQGDKSEAYDDYFLKKIIDNPVYINVLFDVTLNRLKLMMCLQN